MKRHEVTHIFIVSLLFLTSLLLLSASPVLAQNKTNGEACVSASECVSGYCVSGYCSATAGLATCGEGPISGSGCNCGGGSYYSGYCCANVYQSSACGTSTTACSTAYYWNCKTQSECTAIGYYWYSNTNYCSSSPPPQCSSTQKYNCYTQTDCTGAGGNWCNTYCSDSCPTCSSSQVWNCYDQTSCTGAGGKWCLPSGGGSAYCSSATCPTSGGLTNSCSEGPISSSGCNCGGGSYYSGYCCSNVYQGSACGTAGANCGDKICSGSETSSSCPGDCGTSTTETCGNNFCGSGETTTSCAADCKVCGEGPIPSGGCKCGSATQYSGYCCKGVLQYYACGTSETSLPACSEGSIPFSGCKCGGAAYYSGNCCSNVYYASGGCGTTSGYCGDKICSGSETYSSCPSDCGATSNYCGDKICGSSESYASCPGDCGGTSTNTCSSTNYWYCYDQSSCTNVGAKWCQGTGGSNGWCNSPTGTCPSYICEKANPWNCKTESECKTAGAYWYNNYCSSSPPPQCSSSQVWNCYDQTSCKGAGGNWCGNWCSSSPCPTCSSTQRYNCYDQTSCTGAGGKWCTSQGTASGGWCSDSCPTCSSSQPWNCYDETSCKGASGYWCKSVSSPTAYSPAPSSGWCQQSSCPSYTCDKASLWNCYTQGECTGIGGNWCNTYCSSSSCPIQGGYCGDRICSGSETATSCHDDCGTQFQCKSDSECTVFCAKAPCPVGTCKDGKCAYSTPPQPLPTVGYCGWCGDSCSRITHDTICTAVVPPTGFKCLEENGACVKKAYETKPPVTCPPPPATYTQCPTNQYPKPKFDDKGCPTGYECTSGEIGLCPPVPESKISCQPGEELRKSVDYKGCVSGYYCAPTSPGGRCPVTTAVAAPSCPSGSLVPIYDNNGCSLGYNCLPFGCWQEMDQKTQSSRVVCDKTHTQCQAEEELLAISNKCSIKGGKAVSYKDPSGCKFVDCRFTDEEALPDPLRGHTKCPSKTEVDEAVKSCKATGLSPSISFEGGCKGVKCLQEKSVVKCNLPTPEAKEELENQCSAKGLPIVKDIDPNGCAFYRCGETEEETCVKEVPSEAFTKCQQIGGEMIVKKDENACISYVNCITRGDERDTYVDPIEEVPEATELLDIAFKLEKLKIELEKLADQAANIASFYSGRGDEDEERFSRVASMFESAAGRLDEIKADIRNRLDTLSVDDVIEIKRDVKQLKEVTLKDIVYVMLSNSDEVKETIKASKKISVKTAEIEDVEESGTNCGTDGLCFDRAFRVCKPVTFKPEGRYGPTISVIGLDGNICIVKARLPEDMGPPPGVIPGINPPYEMTCKFDEYSFGVRGPEDFIPHCEGPMAELMKQFGTEGPSRRGGSSFEGPGGCNGPAECEEFCSSNPQVCMQWCQANPGVCPEEKLRGHRGPSEHDGFGEYEPGQAPSPVEGTQDCVGCLNNGVCDIGECSECGDCLRG